jgi:formylglycine-generating enzyme required for sulfatase activity
MTGGSGGSGGTVVGPPSCEGGLANTCGSDGKADCCASVIVPGGDFNRGNDDDYPATVGAFRLDLYEVTVARFRKFEADFATGYRPDVGDGDNSNTPLEDGWEEGFTAELPVGRTALRSQLGCFPDKTWTDEEYGNEERPINCVGWYVAFAFCIWDGGWLPTEAEWNFAAAGGDQQRVYPWSYPWTSTYINIDDASYLVVPEDGYCGGDRMSGCTVTDLIRPGSRPDGNGRWEHADLSGNVYEWVRDRWADPYPPSCEDCVVLSGSDTRVARGGCYANNYSLLFTAHRLPFQPQPMGEHSGIGIRCARPLDPVTTAPRN